jgi:hypothetical protein
MVSSKMLPKIFPRLNLRFECSYRPFLLLVLLLHIVKKHQIGFKKFLLLLLTQESFLIGKIF